MRKIIPFLIFLLFFASCISRLRRPAMDGFVVDYNNQAIEGCIVGETITDSTGYYYLKELRYNQFLLTELFAMEAPPLHVYEPVEKDGYIGTSISAHSTFGGGAGKGAHWNMDTIFLRKKNEVFDVDKMVQNHWSFSANKYLDTLYCINANFNPQARDKQDFYYEYMSHCDDYYKKFKNPTLPDSIIKRKYEVTLDDTGHFMASKYVMYRYYGIGKFNRPPDTTKVVGTYKYENGNLAFHSALKELNAIYKIDSIDRDLLILSKIALSK